MGLLGIKRARRMQLYHHDNGDLEFRRLNIVGQAVTEFDETNMPKNAWIDFLKSLYPFSGYKGIPADAVQLAYGRHFYLELNGQNILTPEEKPPNEDSINSPYITAIAEDRAVQLAQAKKPHSTWEKLTIILGIGFIIEMILWGIRIYTSRNTGPEVAQFLDYTMLSILPFFFSRGGKKDGDKKKRQGTDVKKVSNKNWWFITPAIILFIIAIICGFNYVSSMNMLVGGACVVTGVGGVVFLYFGLQGKGEKGYIHEGEKPYTGAENSIVIYARGNTETKLAEPLAIKFEEIEKEKIPEGATLHFLRNLKKHFYELQNIIDDDGKEVEGLKPVKLPDKKYCPPSKFVIASCMQAYREYMEFNPPSTIQKIAPGVLLIAMIIVGILMVVTGPPPTGG